MNCMYYIKKKSLNQNAYSVTSFNFFDFIIHKCGLNLGIDLEYHNLW